MKLIERGMSGPNAIELSRALPYETVPFGDELAYSAALLRKQTRAAGLSLGDRACLALAASTGLPALTADRSWSDAGLDVDIQQLRPA